MFYLRGSPKQNRFTWFAQIGRVRRQIFFCHEVCVQIENFCNKQLLILRMPNLVHFCIEAATGTQVFSTLASPKNFCSVQLNARLQMVSPKLTLACHDQEILRQHPRFAGRSQTRPSCLTYADTHCACISVRTENIQRVAPIRRAVAKSYKSGKPVLHRPPPQLWHPRNAMGDVKYLKEGSHTLVGTRTII
jgi:hypothetical protein